MSDKKAISDTSADVAPVPAKVARKAASASNRKNMERAATTAAAAKPSQRRRATSAGKAPHPAPAMAEASGRSADTTTRTKTLNAATPARKAAATTANGEVNQTPPAATDLVEGHGEASEEARQRWIATAAYHRAEERGFAPGHEVQDWLDAEAEVAELISKAGRK